MTVQNLASRIRLGINIDHVATIRNARGGQLPEPVRAAHLAVAAGADGITAHLREDRRHIRDGDVARLMRELTVPLNFEMAVTEEMLALAIRLKPHAACLVPEKREERTTEGGLDVAGQADRVGEAVTRLKAAGCRASLFIEADEAPITLAAKLGAPVVELHTGSWCEAVSHGEGARSEAEFRRLAEGARIAQALGLEVHAGHGLDYATARRLAAVPEFVEFNIGHFLVGEAIFLGLEGAIRRMRSAMDEGRGL